MTRTALKTLAVIATFGSAPLAAQNAPWRPGFVEPVTPTTMPVVKSEPQSKKSPFASMAKEWPHLSTPQSSEWDRIGLTLRDERVMDSKAFPKNRVLVKSWSADFPKLGDDFEVLEAGTRDASLCASVVNPGEVPPGTYNCIAHTTGIKNVWVNPYQSVKAWDLYYEAPGYTRSRTADTSLEPGVLKVALYMAATPEGGMKFTHAALQHDDGTWSSKLGSGPLIRHRSAESVGGPLYGQVVLVYVKKK